MRHNKASNPAVKNTNKSSQDDMDDEDLEDDDIYNEKSPNTYLSQDSPNKLTTVNTAATA